MLMLPTKCTTNGTFVVRYSMHAALLELHCMLDGVGVGDTMGFGDT